MKSDIERVLYMLRHGDVSGAVAVLQEMQEMADVLPDGCEKCGMDVIDCICADESEYVLEFIL